MKANVTRKLDAGVIREAKVIAAKEGTSVMSDRYFVDTNNLLYAHDRSTRVKHERARASRMR